MAFAVLLTQGSQVIATPTNYTSVAQFNDSNGSDRVGYQRVAGSTSDAVSVTITNANWHGFIIEVKAGLAVLPKAQFATATLAGAGAQVTATATITNISATLSGGEQTNLLLHFNAPNGSTTVVDDSPIPHTVTIQGTAAISTGNSQFGPASMRFTTVAGQRLELDGSADFAFGTGDFTVDFWVYFNTLVLTNGFVLYDSRAVGAQAIQPVIYVTTAGKINFYSNGVDLCAGTTTVATGQWYHVAVTRAFGSTRLFINGTQEGSTSVTVQNYANPAARPAIGGSGFSNSQLVTIDGWMDEVRVIKGRAAWTANFTPPTAPYGNLLEAFSGGKFLAARLAGAGAQTVNATALRPIAATLRGNVSNEQLLLHLDGTNGSTTFTNSSTTTHVATAVGNAQLTTAQMKFGVSSAVFDGTGDAITLDGGADFTFGTGDFSVDLWVRLNATGVQQTLFDFRPAATEGSYPIVAVASSNVLFYFFNSATQIAGTTTLVTGRWYHVALTRASGNTRLFLDGTQEGSTYIDSSSCTVGSNRPAFGFDKNNANGLNGWIDEIRILKGSAAWTANFTRPTNPYTSLTVDAQFLNTATLAGEGILVLAEPFARLTGAGNMIVDVVSYNAHLNPFVGAGAMKVEALWITQQYAEVISSGNPAAQSLRATQQYAETISSGDPAAQSMRITQQYVEVIRPYTTASFAGAGSLTVSATVQ